METKDGKQWPNRILFKTEFCRGNWLQVEIMSNNMKKDESPEIASICHLLSDLDAKKALDDQEEAIEKFTNLIKTNGEHIMFSTRCALHRGWAYQKINRLVDANSDFSLALAFDPKMKGALHERARVYFELRFFGLAREDL